MIRVWYVGYHAEKDALFLYYVDQDDVVWAFANGVLDRVGFLEFLNTSQFVLLGEL